jgi:hypothetical protein
LFTRRKLPPIVAKMMIRRKHLQPGGVPSSCCTDFRARSAHFRSPACGMAATVVARRRSTRFRQPASAGVITRL